MTRIWNRFLSFLLAFALVITMFGSDLTSVKTYAEDASEDEEETVSASEDEDSSDDEDDEEEEEDYEEEDDEEEDDEEEEEYVEETSDESSEDGDDQEEPENPENPEEPEAPADGEAPSDEASIETSEEIIEEVIPEAKPEKEEREEGVIRITYTATEGGSVSSSEETVDLRQEEVSFAGSTASADEGYEFKGWTDADGNTVCEEAEIIPEGLEEDAEFTANFEMVAEAEEEEEPEEIKMPAVSFSDNAGDIRVHVRAGEGAFPEGTKMVVSAVNDSDILDKAERAVDGEASAVSAVDISFTYKGKEIEPKKSIDVRLSNSAIGDAEGIEVVHIDDSGDASVMGSDATGNSVAFSSDEFSVYVIIETGDPDCRLFVKFMNGDEEITSIPVKKADIENFETVLYEPALGTLPDKTSFRGWTREENYTKDTVGLNITQVRNEVADMLPPENDGAEVTYYAMLFKTYTVNYVDKALTSLGSHSIDYIAYANEEEQKQPYTVNMAYTPEDENHAFEGWYVSSGLENIVSKGEQEGPFTEDEIFENNTQIVITGDVTFKVNTPVGRWLIFHENGKGATYIAPQFIYEGDVTKEPAIEMTRNGYVFGGWYKDEACTEGNEFTFGSELEEKTEIWAKWEAKEFARYTVIIHTQNVNCSGYDIKETYVEDRGRVGNPIPWEYVDNKDQDYARIGNNKNIKKEYNGFNLVKSKSDGEVEIVPEGDAVLNLYYDRIVYNFKFYYYRDYAENGYRYSYAHNSRANATGIWSLVSWHNDNREHPTLDGLTDLSEDVGGITAHYFVMQAYYGENIENKWPPYSKIKGTSNGDPISFVRMLGTRDHNSSTGGGSDTVKGKITILDEMILGNTKDADGNYVIVRFSTKNEWRYHIWFETVPSQTYTGEIHTLNGKSYYQYEIVESRSSNTFVDQQNPPSYTGYDNDNIRRMNQNWNGNQSWTTDGNIYHINYVYDRLAYKITYMDGEYIDGFNSHIQNKAARFLHESADINQGMVIADSDKNYVPELPASESGYVFEGWYADSACITKYNFTSMPVGGIVVYAKWRLKQYRVFLHPNVEDRDPSLNWGSSGQEMNFRVNYGSKISTPTGTRDGYSLVGWFTDPGCNNAFNGDAYVLNDTTVTTPYDKTTHMTDTMDKYGEGATTNNDVGRDWITREFNIYAKWRATIEGALGIKVIYNLTDPVNGTGSGVAEDNRLYVDNASAAAVPAVTGPDGYRFSHWVMQRWTGESYEDISGSVIFPGQSFTVLLKNAEMRNPVYGTDDQGKEVIESAEYYVQLRAQYIKNEEATPTYIPWFENDGTEAFYVDKIDNPANYAQSGLGINEAVAIHAPISRQGRKFLGWARIDMGDEQAANDFMTKSSYWTQNDATPWLFYDEETNAFYTDSEFTKVATQIAADESMPYQAMFAVWDLVDGKYTVHYIDRETGNPVSEDKTQDPQALYEEVTEEAIPVTGFEVDGATAAVFTLTDTETEKEITFYYIRRSNLKYTVHYYLEDSTTDVPGLSDKNVTGVTFGEKREETAATATGYEVVSAIDTTGNTVDGDSTIIVSFEETVDDQVVIFYYAPVSNLEYTVNYLERGTNKPLAEPETIGEQTYHDEVRVQPNPDKESQIIPYYDRDFTPPEKITIELSGNVVNFYYTAREDFTYTVHYYKKDTTEPVAPSVSRNKRTYGQEYEEKAKTVDGWYVDGESTKKFTLETDGQEIIFYYVIREDLRYRVKYLDVDDSNINVFPEIEVPNVSFKSKQTETAPDATDKGYYLDESCEEEKSITISTNDDDNIIIFYYKKRADLEYKVHYYKENTAESVWPDKPVYEQVFGTSVTEKAVENVPGWKPLEPKTKQFTIDVVNDDVIFYYTKATDLEYTVHYYLEGTTKKVTGDKVVGGQTFEDTVYESPVEVSDYYIIDKDEKHIQISANNEENVIIFYYGAKSSLTIKAIGGSTEYSAEEHSVKGFNVSVVPAVTASPVEELVGNVVNFFTGLFTGIKVQAMDVSESEGNNTFEMNGQTYNVEGITSGASRTDAGTTNTEFIGKAAVMLDGEDVTERFSISYENAKLEISKRKVTFTSATDSKTDDGRPLFNHNVTISEPGLCGNDKVTFDVTGVQVGRGSSKNWFTWEMIVGNPDNYDVTVVEGTLTIRGGSGGGDNPPGTTDVPDDPTPTAATPTPGPAAAVLGERREAGNGQAVLGARRGKTEDTSGSTTAVLAILISAAVAVSLLIFGKKKEDEDENENEKI
ncbi:MAG: InlB B-repeat-containing protein [Butyrivibrio sp.]|nr:InlB B-repeat-containing protein [Butyrivibrio sp.]